jgi:hypothetical protein
MAVVLKIFKTRPTICIQTDDLAIKAAGFDREILNRVNDWKKARGEVLSVPRIKPRRSVVLNRQPSISVELQLVQPLVAGRQNLRRLQEHRCDECRNCQRENIPFRRAQCKPPSPERIEEPVDAIISLCLNMFPQIGDRHHKTGKAEKGSECSDRQ